MQVNKSEKEYLDGVLDNPVLFSEVLKEENAERLRALGFESGYNHLFMLDPMIASTEECQPINPGVGVCKTYTLISDGGIVVFTGRKGVYEVTMMERFLEEKVTWNTRVYPLYFNEDYSSLASKLFDEFNS